MDAAGSAGSSAAAFERPLRRAEGGEDEEEGDRSFARRDGFSAERGSCWGFRGGFR